MVCFAAPTVPRSLKAYSNSSTELVIHWNPPAVPNGNVTHYVVRGTWEHDDQKFLEQRNYCSERKSISYFVSSVLYKTEIRIFLNKIFV